MNSYVVYLRIVMRHHDHRGLSVFIEHADDASPHSLSTASSADEAKRRAVARVEDLLPGKVIRAERVVHIEGAEALAR